MIRLDNIKKTYLRSPVIDGLDLNIAPGERFVLLGKSGSGKTTLLRLIAGFENPDEGEIFIDEKKVNDWPPEKRRIGYVFQNPELFPHMNVEDNISLGLKINEYSALDSMKRTDECLEMLNMLDYRKAWPRELSGGEAKRVALARSLVLEPAVLLLDEALSALDEKTRSTLQMELMEIQSASKTTLLFVTHDQREAMLMADNMGVIQEGKIMQTGRPEEIYDRPANPFIAHFLGESNQVEGLVSGCYAEGLAEICLKGGAKVRGFSFGRMMDGQQALCLFRPDRLEIDFEDQFSEETSNTWKGEIRRRVFVGGQIEYLIHIDRDFEIRVAVDREKTRHCQIGEIVNCRVDEKSVLIYPKRDETS